MPTDKSLNPTLATTIPLQAYTSQNLPIAPISIQLRQLSRVPQKYFVPRILHPRPRPRNDGQITSQSTNIAHNLLLPVPGTPLLPLPGNFTIGAFLLPFRKPHAGNSPPTLSTRSKNPHRSEASCCCLYASLRRTQINTVESATSSCCIDYYLCRKGTLTLFSSSCPLSLISQENSVLPPCSPPRAPTRESGVLSEHKRAELSRSRPRGLLLLSLHRQ